MRALQSGRAVFCEWPLGANVAEAEQMANLAAERKLRTAVGLQARDGLHVVRAREPVERGEGVAVVVEGTVADDQRVSRGAAGDDHERDGRFPPELGGDRLEIRLGRYLRLCSTERL